MMNKEDIKKALKCCNSSGPYACNNCPYYYYAEGCRDGLIDASANLITEQEKEIEFQVQDRARLQREIDELEQAHEQRVEEIEQLKAENKNLKDDFDSLYKDYEFVRDCDAEHCLEINETVKQAKIDALNELKEKAISLSAIEAYHICGIADEMIEELKK